MKKAENRPGYKLVFSKYITLKNGKRLYAANYGLEAFSFWVRI